MSKKIEYYEAKESFVTHFNGDQISVQAGELVQAGHEILKGRKELFKPATSITRFSVEQATAAPGEKRGQK